MNNEDKKTIWAKVLQFVIEVLKLVISIFLGVAGYNAIF